MQSCWKPEDLSPNTVYVDYAKGALTSGALTSIAAGSIMHAKAYIGIEHRQIVDGELIQDGRNWVLIEKDDRIPVLEAMATRLLGGEWELRPKRNRWWSRGKH